MTTWTAKVDNKVQFLEFKTCVLWCDEIGMGLSGGRPLLFKKAAETNA